MDLNRARITIERSNERAKSLDIDMSDFVSLICYRDFLLSTYI